MGDTEREWNVEVTVRVRAILTGHDVTQVRGKIDEWTIGELENDSDTKQFTISVKENVHPR